MNQTRVKDRKERSDAHGDNLKSERAADQKKKSEDERAQDSIMVPEKQGGIAGP